MKQLIYRKCRSCFAIVLAFIVLLQLAIGMQSPTAYAESSSSVADPALTDLVQVSIDGGNKQILKLYTNGLYEAKLANLANGSHTYTVYYNGQAAETGTITPATAQDVYIRFRPFQSDKIIDSINDSAYFKTPAAWVGSFSDGLNSYLPTSIRDWAPNDSNGYLDYQGGGIYSKTFTFAQALTADVALTYKIAFGGDWNHGNIGNNSGGNISVTIPAGKRSITIWADSVNMVSFNSVNGTPFNAAQGDDIPRYEKPAGTVSVSLALSTNGVTGTVYNNLTQVSETLYAYTALFAAGDYAYNTVFDSVYRYQNGGNQTLTLSQDSVVTFLYDAAEDKLYDSIHAAEMVELMLGFAKPVDLDALDQQAYSGNDLGAAYTPGYTQFKVWAPTASRVQLKLYRTGDVKEDSAILTEDMQKQDNGIWYLKKDGDLKGVFYTYLVTVGLKTNETVDIYTKAVGINGNRGMIVDLNDTNPYDWVTDKYVLQKKMTDSVIWETHVNDFSSDSNSGISKANQGKFIAFTERGTTLRGEGKVATGVDHLVQLGVNYVHLLPAFDFDNFETDNVYNWGYNPKNYNVPEGSYSTNPADGNVRIKEFKEMVQGLHKANIGLIMDVVYNHTAKSATSWFNLTVPDYYYRHKADGSFSDGSGCGNETASERAMFRKYMVDSVLYWATEYHVDGFRFDLMALHDVDTMNAIRIALNDAGLSNVIMYGEPWTGGTSAIPASLRPTNKTNVKYLDDGIAVFNDDLRDATKGYVFNATDKGFVQGGNIASPNSVESTSRKYSDVDLIAGIQANANPLTAQNSSWTKDAWAKNPAQSISYVSAHDDLSLWDKLVVSVDGVPSDARRYAARDKALVAMNKIAATTILTSQGIPFFQAGEEFARTKYGDHNSYESPVEINQLDWSRLETFSDLNDYYKGLIQIRKQYAPFRDATASAIQNMVFSDDGKENLVAYTIQDASDTVAVLMNSTTETQTVTLKSKNGILPDNWTILANKDKASLKSLGTLTGARITVPAQSAMVLVGMKPSDGSTGGDRR